MTFSQVIRAVFRDTAGVLGQTWILFLIVVAVLAPVLTPYHPQALLRFSTGELAAFQPPSSLFWFGTTNLGRDVFSQVIMGTRTALLMGFTAAAMATLIGTVYGTISGYFRGVVDDLLMRILEVAYTIPFEPLAILLLSLAPSRSIWTVVLAIGLVFWRQPTRVVRNQVLSIRERGFVQAARAVGASDWYILTRHVIPNVLPITFVYIPVAFGNAMLAEASISFLGFGNPDQISWGQILRYSFTEGALVRAWWWSLTPGLAITLTSAAAFFSTRPFEVILNPRLRGS